VKPKVAEDPGAAAFWSDGADQVIDVSPALYVTPQSIGLVMDWRFAPPSTERAKT